MTQKELPFEQHTRTLIQRARHREGLLVARKWVEAKPANPEAWFYKSVCEMMLLKPKQGLASVETALALNGDSQRYQAQAARCMVGAGQVMDGLQLARAIADREKRNAHILDAVANTISNAGEHEEAIPIFERAIALNSSVPQYYSNLGTVLHFCRRTAEAEAAHRKALELMPEDFRAYWLLGQLRKATADDNFVDWFEHVLKRYGDKLHARTTLNYALAKQHEDLEQYDQTFVHLEQGAEAVLEHTPYPEASNQRLFSKYREDFSEDFCQQTVPACDNEEPVFIVGMPRTGTTLVERIIASDEQVFAAGELHNFMHLFNQRYGALNANVKDYTRFSGIENVDYRELGESYIDSTRPRTGHTRHFIDKYPFNFQMVGPIALSLPRAKIIHLTRNPMDTCFSNYKLLFMLGSGLYSYDQETLGRFYLQYHSLMNHWHRCFPGRILDVSYEKLVQQPEVETRRIMTFLGLEWRPELLEFYKSSEAVSTASTSQIREPINTASLYKWKRFAKHLKHLRQVLETNGIEIESASS
ncbi:MAG: sulfotransferase [Pseudomonadales bacterium]